MCMPSTKMGGASLVAAVVQTKQGIAVHLNSYFYGRRPPAHLVKGLALLESVLQLTSCCLLCISCNEAKSGL